MDTITLTLTSEISTLFIYYDHLGHKEGTYFSVALLSKLTCDYRLSLYKVIDTVWCLTALANIYSFKY